MPRLSAGINRNIVECKDVKDYASSALPPVLIETLWNVKMILDDSKNASQ